MEGSIIHKLRQNQQLQRMADGREGVPITVQFKGPVPALPRPERKEWLAQHFGDLKRELADLPIQMDTASISLSGQTVEAICAVDYIEKLRSLCAGGEHDIEIIRTIQAT